MYNQKIKELVTMVSNNFDNKINFWFKLLPSLNSKQSSIIFVLKFELNAIFSNKNVKL